MAEQDQPAVSSVPNKPPVLTILLPVRHEGVNVPIMMKLMSALVETPHEVLIIYDTADDDTIPAARAVQSRYPQVRLVHNDLGRGVINALRKGVQEAKAPYVLVTCIDEVGPLLALDEMVDLLDDGCDFVAATRYAYGGRRLSGSFFGHVLSCGSNMILKAFGSVLTDATCGLKMFRRSCFDKLNLESKPIGWVVAFEIGLKAQLCDLKLGEVPCLSFDRLYGGQSTFRIGPWFIEYLKWLFWGVREFHKRRHRPVAKPIIRIPAVTATKSKKSTPISLVPTQKRST